jgi:hypothetical protein
MEKTAMLRSTLFAALLLSGQALASEADILTAASGDSKGDNWDATVAQAVLSTYDSNGSGSIESSKELKAFSCTSWQAIDASVRAGWGGTGLRVIYGFQKGMIWVGYAVGIDEKLRKKADKALVSCGIE